MIKILITGASGFIGSHFHLYLSQEQIINLDLVAPSFDAKSTYVKGDIRKKEDIKAVLEQYDVDLIINLAAEHKDFGIERASYFKTNEEGMRNICEAASEAGVKNIVFYSSVAVYGSNKEPSTESMPPNPNLPYGESKLAGEKVLDNWVKEQPEHAALVIRPVVVYGERNVANMYRLIDQISRGRFFNIGKGKNVKSIAYVQNLVEATLFLIEKMKPGMAIYNYSDEPQLSSRSIATVISEALGKRKPITFPYWLIYAMGIPFDWAIKLTGKDLPISTNRIKKFNTETYHKADKVRREGFSPKWTNKEGLQRMVAWYQKVKK